MTEKLNNLRQELEAASMAYVGACNSGKIPAERKKLKEAVKAATDAYNLELEKQTYLDWAAAGDPVKTCIRERFIRGGKRVSFKEADDGTMTGTIKDVDFKADLPMMHKVLGAGVFASPDWLPKVEKLAWIMASNLNNHLADNPAFAYAASDAAKEFSFPAEIKCDTDSAVYIALQMVIDSILFIPDEKSRKKEKPNLISLTMKTDKYGATFSPQWVYIRESLTRQGNLNQVVIGNIGKMAELIADAMHGIITNGDFTLTADK